MVAKRKPAAKPKSKAKPKAPSKPKAKTAVTRPSDGVPALEEVTAWYRSLLASGTYQTSYEVQAFLYDPLWSDDAEIERVFEAWADSVGVDNLPMELLEDHLVTAGRFDQLHRFFTMLSPALLERALPLARALVARPRRKRDTRYDEITE